MNQISEKEKVSEKYVKTELPNSWWNRVYFAVIVFTVLVISSLALFSWYFS